MAEKSETRKNEKIGQVVSARTAKTIVVVVTRRVAHGTYKRIVTRRKKFYAHDEESKAKVGDMVRIIESRPMSRLKRWRLGEIVRSAVEAGATIGELGIGGDTQERVTKKKKE
jgi:small subunit ribosomal protein S17